MASKTSIANNALLKLGSNTIISLDEDSEQARNMNIIFDDNLDNLLEMHPWNFAINRATLARLSEDPDHEWTYQYQLPTNPYCLKVIKVYNDYPFRVEGRYLMSNYDEIQIEYISRVTDMNKLSPLFRESLALYLAVQLAHKFQGSSNQKKVLQDEFDFMLRKAKLRDAQEGSPYAKPEGDWITKRRNQYYAVVET